jgi:AraC family ethanolamine operon transcriptional activator
LVQLETVLAEHPYRLSRIQDITRSIGVSQQTLRVSCSRHLGMSPLRYQRLRRLKLVRAELMSRRPALTNSAEVIDRYGFGSLHHFVTEYWEVFGEMPPVLPRSDAD